MYFWRIFKLRQQLATQPLQSGSAVSYLVAFMIIGDAFLIAQAWFDFYPKVSWFPGYLALLGVIELIGVYACYHANGRSSGSNFLSKFFALAWVLFCRFIVFGAIIAVIGLAVIELFTQQHRMLTPHYWWISLFLLVWLIVYYWRLTVHIKTTV